MADAGAPDRKANGKRVEASSTRPARAPCCGLPSPLASAIRHTVAEPVAPCVAASGEVKRRGRRARETG
ncbi:hypothetical protein [Lysobacter capsici]|uniref:hypothetical protein n=1 Tax=Lysobacter capsici TaxID=435897 RepID=UPI0011E014FB|nr:hypothetical protein [Lysobacter capsici]